jgi:hypothetical protein
MPDTFNYTYERMSPKDLPTLAECRELLGDVEAVEEAAEGARGGRGEGGGVADVAGEEAEEVLEQVGRVADEVGRLLGKLVLPRDVRARKEAAAAAA